jgi:hypothetical protein
MADHNPAAAATAAMERAIAKLTKKQQEIFAVMQSGDYDALLNLVNQHGLRYGDAFKKGQMLHTYSDVSPRIVINRAARTMVADGILAAIVDYDAVLRGGAQGPALAKLFDLAYRIHVPQKRADRKIVSITSDML